MYYITNVQCQGGEVGSAWRWSAELGHKLGLSMPEGSIIPTLIGWACP